MTRNIRKAVVLGLTGLALGAIAGGMIGTGCGLVFTSVFQARSTDAYSGMLIFLTFMPIGVVSGAISGAIGLGTVAFYIPAAPARMTERKVIS